MAPSSREAISPEVPDECPFSAPSPRGAMMVQKFQMHVHSLPNVPRMRLQFFVCCGTCVLSVGLFFLNAKLVFLRPCLFRRLVKNFSVLLLFRRLQFETTSSGVRVGIRMGFQVSGCAGVPAYGCVSVCFFSVGTCLSLNVSTTRGTIPLTMVAAQHDRIPSLPYNHWLAPDKREVEWVSVWRRSDWNSAGGRNDTACFFDFLARQGAGVYCVSLGACVACFDSTTVMGHVPFMVSPS